MIGITAYGAYVPRLRIARRTIVDANAWYASGLAGKAKGTRALANHDEDSLTMAVAAARDCLGGADDRGHVSDVLFASGTLPFAERLNAGVVCEALTLDRTVRASDVSGSQRSALSALAQAVAQVAATAAHATADRSDATRDVLLVAADTRDARPASTQELDFGDGAAAVLVGSEDVLAEYLGRGTVTVDFVDHFREAGETIDYYWEERWVRDEGIAKLVPQAVERALKAAGVEAAQVDHFIFPCMFAKMDQQVAKRCGVKPEAVADQLAAQVGDTGVAHALLMLAHVLERATPGQVVLLVQFASGAEAIVLRATEHIRSFAPVHGVSSWIERGTDEPSYTKFLAFKGQLALERGIRGEQDRKTALTTAYRHRSAILGLVAGRSGTTGQVHFPPSRRSLTEDGGSEEEQDTQRPYKLADRRARVLSWSAEFLSFHRAPPHTYGQVDFDGGGRILMEFTDVAKGDIEVGTEVEMVFRIKDIDDRRGFTRYFWKATPVRRPGAAPTTTRKDHTER